MSPEASVLGSVGVVVVSLFVYFAVVGLRRLAAGAFVLSLALLSYPFFAGLTEQGRGIFVFGPLFGVIALVTSRRGNAKQSSARHDDEATAGGL